MYRENRLKKRLRAGEDCLGCWLFLGSPVVTEILSLTGFDALIIDQEHAPGGLETCFHQLRAAAAAETTMLVRLADNQPMFFKQILDAGAEGVIVANMESGEEAERAVAASRYPPRGFRGAHVGAARATDWGLHIDDYLQTIEDNLLVIGLIESARGVAAIPEMTRVDGIDMLCIGPRDLSASIAKMSRFDDPEFKELIDEAERRIVEGGKWLGGGTLPGITPADMFARGYNFVSNCSDLTLLRGAALEAAAAR